MVVREGYYSEQARDQSYFMLYDKLPDKRKKVFDWLLKNKPSTNQEIADGMKWQINCVTPRILELRKLGLVCFLHYKIIEKVETKISVWSIPKEVLKSLFDQVELDFGRDE